MIENSKEENSKDFCPNYVQEFGLGRGTCLMPDDRYIKMKALVENYKTFPMYIYINLRSLSTEMLNLRKFCITVISTCEAYYPCILLTENTECQDFYPVVLIGSPYPLRRKRVLLPPTFGSKGRDTLTCGEGMRDPVPTMEQD